MHGYGLLPVFLVNGEVDSMGGVVEDGIGIACKTSPSRVTIERTQGDLRQEYSVRDKTKRELEFLEKGGNSLDLFKLGYAASVSVQSTSFTNQNQAHLVNSEAKGSFAFTASPQGNSLESSGRLGANHSEPNSAEYNHMLLDGEHEFSEGNLRSLHPTRSNIVPSKTLSQMDWIHKTGEHADSTGFNVPRKAYKRRNRSRPNPDGIRFSSVDVNTNHGNHGFSLPSRHGKDLEGLTLIPDAENKNISINCDSERICPKDGAMNGLTDTQQIMELDGGKAVESCKDLLEHVAVEAASDAIASETPLDDQWNQESQPGALETRLEKISDASEAVQAREEMGSAVNEYQLIGTVNEIGNESTSCKINSSSSKKYGTNCSAHNTIDLFSCKVFNSQSSCVQNKSIDENNSGDMCHNMTNANFNGKNGYLPSDGMLLVESDEFVQEKIETGCLDGWALDNTEKNSTHLMQQEKGRKLHTDEELNGSRFAMKSEVKNQTVIQASEPCEPSASESGTKPDLALYGNPEPHGEIPYIVESQHSVDTSISDVLKGGNLTCKSSFSLEAQTSSCLHSNLQPEIDEDLILKEAKIIPAKRKRISDLSVMNSARKIRRKSQRDFVLEEMAWLANDFSQLRKREKCPGMEAKKVAHILAKSIKEFWHLVEENKRDCRVPVQAYAMRFLKHNSSTVIDNQAEVPLTPDRASDMGILELSWEDSLTEENLFFTVLPGAMMSIESQVAQCEFQRDSSKKAHQPDSSGNSGLFGPPVMKKPKIMQSSQDNSFENIAPVGRSAPSPVASQMSNNPKKFIKMLGGRDRGRKPKDLKMHNEQLASGSPWTLFEDQALVVLAHDLGPNWELVTDAINSTLPFK